MPDLPDDQAARVARLEAHGLWVVSDTPLLGRQWVRCSWREGLRALRAGRTLAAGPQPPPQPPDDDEEHMRG